MRNIFIILMLTLVAYVSTAQDKTRYIGSGGALAVDNYFPAYLPSAGMSLGDTVSTNHDSIAVQTFINKPQATYYNWQTKVLDVSSGGKVSVSLQGKKFNAEAFTNITTVIYYGSGNDSTINFTQETTKQFYNTYRVLYKFVAGKTKISSCFGSIKY
jgi:hypothetical protein